MENKNEETTSTGLENNVETQVPLVLPGNLSAVASVTPLPLPLSLLLSSVHSASSTWPFSPHLAQTASKSPQASGSEDSAPESLHSSALPVQIHKTPTQEDQPTSNHRTYLGWPQRRLGVGVLFQKPPRENSPELGTLFSAFVSDTALIIPGCLFSR